jgi:hypothetical protein
MVVIKLIAPRIEDAPAIRIDRIAKSTAGQGWPDVESGARASNRCRRHSNPARLRRTSKCRTAQTRRAAAKMRCFHARKRDVRAPIISGTIQLPNPPIIAGISVKHDQAMACHEHVSVCVLVKSAGGAAAVRSGSRLKRFRQSTRAHREHDLHRADIFVVGRIELAPPSGGMTVLEIDCRICCGRNLMFFYSDCVACLLRRK